MSERSRRARAVMVLGTTSGAGKSFLTTALCRFYAREGFKVAPFKAQNMSNNARVVEGGEIGSAQYFQALAAQTRPNVRMNPVLLKPEADTFSQVVVSGCVRSDIAQIPWKERKPVLWPLITDALASLMHDHDVVVIEGAGSPTEINLMGSDLVNLPVAREANATTLLITDIDRGGAFAHLYGTYHFLPPQDRGRLKGFVLNRFRGDERLLEPGPSMLEECTGVPTIATLPLWRNHGLPEEDALAPVFSRNSGTVFLRIAVIAYPYISNHDEFQSLMALEGIDFRWVRSVLDLSGLEAKDWIILPGSKQTQKDLAWLKDLGLNEAIQRHAALGGAVLGICGGLQMLGHAIHDPNHVESPGSSQGLALLPVVTEFHPAKHYRSLQERIPDVRGPWMPLSHQWIEGYEIRHGISFQIPEGDGVELLYGRCFQNMEGNVLGIYSHGLFESSDVIRAFFGRDARGMDQVFEGLADFIVTHGGRSTWLNLLNE